MRPIHILMAEDNDGDILLTREAFAAAKILTNFSVVKDGKEAIDFLARQGNYTEVGVPDLLLLDVNMPRKNGQEVLQYIKSVAHLQHIPVFMLSTSSSPKDVKQAQLHHAKTFLTKPINIKEFLEAIGHVADFSLAMVKIQATHEARAEQISTGQQTVHDK